MEARGAMGGKEKKLIISWRTQPFAGEQGDRIDEDSERSGGDSSFPLR